VLVIEALRCSMVCSLVCSLLCSSAHWLCSLLSPSLLSHGASLSQCLKIMCNITEDYLFRFYNIFNESFVSYKHQTVNAKLFTIRLF